MVKKSSHPDAKLFEYLNGALDSGAGQVIEAHLSICEDCASVAAVVRALKKAASVWNSKGADRVADSQTQDLTEHPDISELASLFHTKSRQAEAVGVITHVALCSTCAEAVAQYASAERVAADYQPAKAATGEVPEKAREMIRDWEHSGFAELKPASEVLGQELLDRLSSILGERQTSQPQPRESRSQVKVLIVSSSGEVRGVEFFERAIDSTGANILRHSEGSAHFDNKAVHELLDLGERDPFVASNLVRQDTIRLEQARPRETSRRGDYIIIED
ncbi:MAG: zf-HC2 domain-containing protein [Blastocatellia bacterium]